MPWLRVLDVPSHGRSRKVHGVKIDSLHHPLSDLEYGYLLVAEFSSEVLDIRELPISQLAVYRLRDFKRLPDAHLKAVSKSDRRSTVLDLTYIGWPSSLSRRQPIRI